MSNLLDFCSYRAKINSSNLKNNIKNLFDWLLYSVSENNQVKERIATFKNEVLLLFENSAVSDIQKIEDELVVKIDTIIEKMIYAIYDELVKLHNFYSNQYRENYEIPWLPAYYFSNRTLRRKWMESLLNSTLILNEAQSQHPVANIITMLARFGNEAKRMVRDHLRALNKTAGIPNNNLGGTVVSTQDISNVPYKFASINDEDPFASNNFSGNSQKPINVVPPATQQKTVDTSNTFAMQDPRTGSPISKEERQKRDYERYKDLIEPLKQEKDISKFLEKLQKIRIPILKKILRAVTEQDPPFMHDNRTKGQDLIDFAKQWHMKTHGYQSTNQPNILQGQSATATPTKKRGRPKKNNASIPQVPEPTPPVVQEPAATEPISQPKNIVPEPELKPTTKQEPIVSPEIKKVAPSIKLTKKKAPNENTIIIKDKNEISNAVSTLAKQYGLKQSQENMIGDIALNLSDNIDFEKYDFSDLFLLIQDTIKKVISSGGDRSDIEQKLLEKIKEGEIPYLDDNIQSLSNDDQASDDDIAAYRRRRGR